jgi:DUF2911 family protein
MKRPSHESESVIFAKYLNFDYMKKGFLALFLFICAAYSHAQTPANKLPEVDKSPMDMSYFPNDYPVLKIQNKVTEPVIARVIYSRPQKNDRLIFGGLVEFGKVWRLGANEATEIEFYKEVRIGGKKVAKGRYTLYAIAYPDTWTIIINKDTDTWGAFKYDEKKDLVRTTIPVQKNSEITEALAMTFEPILSSSGKATKNFSLTIAWDSTKVSLPILL